MVESKLTSSCLSQKNRPQQYEPPKTKRKCLLYLPERPLGIATKDRTRCESKDHRTRGLIFVTRYAAWQGTVKFPHQDVIRVFVRSMVCLIKHK